MNSFPDGGKGRDNFFESIKKRKAPAGEEVGFLRWVEKKERGVDEFAGSSQLVRKKGKWKYAGGHCGEGKSRFFQKSGRAKKDRARRCRKQQNWWERGGVARVSV